MRIVAIVLTLTLATMARAEEPPARLEFLSGWRTDGGTHMAAFRVVLAPGWKTYWRSPGDAGIPPRFDWTQSRNLAGVRVHWPRPQVFNDYGLRTIGYADELILPLEFTPTMAGRPMVAAGRVEIGVCRELCVPMEFGFRADLPDGTAPAPGIQTALGQVPRTRPGNSVRGLSCRVDPIADGMRITASLPADTGDAGVAIIEHSDQTIWVSEATVSRKGHTLEIAADMVPPSAKPFSLDRGEVLLTLVGKEVATEIRGCPAG